MPIISTSSINTYPISTLGKIALSQVPHEAKWWKGMALDLPSHMFLTGNKTEKKKSNFTIGQNKTHAITDV